MRLYVMFVLLMAALSGCAAGPHAAVTSATGDSLNQATAHVQSAEKVNQMLPPYTNPTGQALVKVISGEHAAAQAQLAQAAKQLAAVQTQINAMDSTIKSLQGQVLKYKNSWGYRFEVFVMAFLTLLLILVGIHFGCVIAAVVIGMFFPTVVFVVPILQKIAAIVNPLGWGQYVIDHFHCNVQVAAAATPAPKSA